MHALLVQAVAIRGHGVQEQIVQHAILLLVQYAQVIHTHIAPHVIMVKLLQDVLLEEIAKLEPVHLLVLLAIQDTS